jgi:PPOX class probable F420-dependent enzyme
MRLRKTLVRLVERERVCRVATADPSGRPHVVPVCHVWEGGKLYFAADADSRKVRHLRANPHVAVVVDVYAEDWARLAGVVLWGTARVVRGGSLYRRIRTRLYRKYPQYPEEAAIEAPQTVIVEVTPTRAASWGLD